MSKDAPQKVRNSINVNIELILFEEDGIWVAYCPALELSSYGDNENEAKQAFEEAMSIFLSETDRKGTLERYLLKLGWQLQQKPKPVYNPPTISLRREQRLLRRKSHIYNEKVRIPVA